MENAPPAPVLPPTPVQVFLNPLGQPTTQGPASRPRGLSRWPDRLL